MNVRIICIGKLKEDYLKLAISEYQKRLSRFCTLEIIELPEEKLPLSPSNAQIAQCIQAEGERILKTLSQGEYVFALSPAGKQLSSEEAANRLDALICDGKGRQVFIIGGSYGLSDAVLSRADCKLSFSRMTFPHQLFRVMLVEQLYRWFKIINNESYHK